MLWSWLWGEGACSQVHSALWQASKPHSCRNDCQFLLYFYLYLSQRNVFLCRKLLFLWFLLGCHSLCGLLSWLQGVLSFSARGIAIGWGAAVQVNHVSRCVLGAHFSWKSQMTQESTTQPWSSAVFCFLSKHSRKSGPLTGSSPTLLGTPTNSPILLPGWHISHVTGATFHIPNGPAVQVLLV